MKTLLITGGTGFLGKYLIDEALKQNYKVVVSVRKSSNASYFEKRDIQLIQLDFQDKKSMTEKFNQIANQGVFFDHIIHNAGLTQGKKSRNFEEVNYKYTVLLIEALSESQQQPLSFLYTSSMASFGPGNSTSLNPVTETCTPSPITAYGRSKLKAEQYLQQQNKIPYIIFRPTAIYGPGTTNYLALFKLIQKHIELFLCPREQHLTFIHAHDVALAYFAVLEKEIKNKSYFLTDGSSYTTSQFYAYIKTILNSKTIQVKFPTTIIKGIASLNEKIAKLTGSSSIFNKEKAKELTSINWECDVSPLFTDINFQPKFDLKTGLIDTAEWYKQKKLL